MGLIEVALDAGRSFPVTQADPFGGPISVLHHLLDTLEVRTDPVAAPLAIVAGTVAGVAAPGTARCAAIGLSPLSGGVAETRAEGPFAAGLRAAGVTGVILTGGAVTPVCVVIEDGTARLAPAADLWGLETGPATDLLQQRYGDNAAVAVIGPAGENGVRYASIVTCRHHPLPRLGLGAVLGGKLVKAVVCVGTRKPPVAAPSVLERISAAYAAAMPANKLAAWQRDWPGFGVWSGEPGYATVANFSDTSGSGGIGVVPAELARTARVAACPGCPTDCIKVYAGAGLHQEALAMLGPGLGVADPWPLLARCEQLGLDPVSLGGTLAAAGVRPADVPATVERVGAGDPLAEGSARCTPGSAMTSNGVELPPFDPRVQPNLGLAYVVAPIGPRYDTVEHDLDFDPDEGLPECFDEVRALGIDVPRPRGELDVARTAQLMRLWSGLDALGVCLFAATPTRPLRLTQVVELVHAITGHAPDVLALGTQRLLLQHEINKRQGVGVGRLPEIFFTDPVRRGRYAGAVLDRAAFAEAASGLQADLGFQAS